MTKILRTLMTKVLLINLLVRYSLASPPQCYVKPTKELTTQKKMPIINNFYTVNAYINNANIHHCHHNKTNG
ncbi:hypothetical protein AMTRI_Chr09g14850 [Amborella trichopoda]